MATLTTSYQQIASKYIGTVSGSGVAAKDVYLKIYAKYNSQNIANNNSSVSYKSTLYVTGSGTYFWTGTPTTKSLSGSGATATSGDAQGNYYLGETTLCEITGTVSHSADGKASVSVTASWVSGPWGISGSVTGSADLPQIARATTPTLSATSVTMGGSITITMNPADSSFKHKLRYAFGSLKDKADAFSIVDGFSAQGNTTATFTPPTSLGSQIPSAMSGSCTISCYTYKSDGTHIGTVSKTVTLNIPGYSLSGSISLTGKNLLSSEYVKTKSSVAVAISASTSYGATIKSYSSTLDGKSYSGNSFTSSIFSSSGSKSVSTIVTDSRGKTVTLTSATMTVRDYASPAITELTAVRQSVETTVVVTIKGTVSAVNSKNAKTIKVTLGGVTNTITSSSYTINGTTTFTNVSTDNSFDVTATITDSYTSVSRNIVLSTVAVTLDFYKDGTGIAMGKVAEHPKTLDIAWDAKIDGDVTITGDLRVQGETLQTNWSTLAAVYPVGSIYMSVSSTSPAVLFGGGSWEQLKNRFLIGCGDMYSQGATGGEAEHTLSVSEIPSHNHAYGVYDASSSSSLEINHMAAYTGKVNSTGWGSHTLFTGEGKAHNNMPPFLAVYMWKRIS